MFDRIKRTLFGEDQLRTEDPETQSQQEFEINELERNGLSLEIRIYCFLGCLLLSIICSLLGSPMLFAGKLTEFAVMVSLGSVISICGTFFLSGPLTQLKKMVDPSRLVSTVIFFAMIIVTLIAGLSLKNPPLAVLCIIGQYLSMIWYSLTYIPYSRQMISTCFSRLF